MQVRSGFVWVPLMEHLTNGQFTQTLHRMSACTETTEQHDERSTCGCDCGEEVTGSRTFVNQTHYTRYLKRTPLWGKNAFLKP